MYGGLDIEVSNVVFVHGSIDPWHALGITKTQDDKAPAIYIEGKNHLYFKLPLIINGQYDCFTGTAHCANMYPKSENDLPQLQAAREQIAALIDSWIRL